jgi:hypothetical protein
VEQWARENGAELISTDTEPGAARAGGGRPPQSERARLVQRRPRAPPKLAPLQASAPSSRRSWIEVRSFSQSGSPWFALYVPEPYNEVDVRMLVADGVVRL